MASTSDHPLAIELLTAMWSSLGGSPDIAGSARFSGPGELPSCFPVTDFAAASLAAAGLAAAEAARPEGLHSPGIAVDRRLASLWFGFTLQPDGWQIPAPWDPIAGDYATDGGWIRLHTNAPHHRAAALDVLGCAANKDDVAAAVARWDGEALENAVVARGGCAALMRHAADWRTHPQGLAVAAEPLVARRDTGEDGPSSAAATPGRPLAGIRVLDLTRVLAGPVATRILAGLGAEVLRIDPPDWDEPGVIPEVTLGKACARLDLKSADGLATLRGLLARADILVHGYRNGALDRLGLDAATRRAIRPGLVDVSLDAYGWTGPWADRRGFDSLVQMSIGIAQAGMDAYRRERPTPLPVQALDHATGCLMAAAALRGLASRRRGEGGSEWRLSLARTGMLLAEHGGTIHDGTFAPVGPADRDEAVQATSWGPARRLRPPLSIAGVRIGWDLGASALGSAESRWRT